jgi:hypothetical protein
LVRSASAMTASRPCAFLGIARLFCAGTGEDATAMADEATAALATLTAEVARLRQSLALMLETQATQSEMLRQLLEAAAAPTEPENRLADVLAQIAATLRDQGLCNDNFDVRLATIRLSGL